ncbi:MAG: imelysin family protein [Polyangiaceae bacterium]
MVRSAVRHRDGLLVVTALALLLTTHACVEISTSTTTASGSAGGVGQGGLSDERIREVLSHLAAKVIAPAYQEAADAAAQLDVAAKALAADPTEANREKAQQAWQDAMKAWQAAELMQVGPSGVSEFVLGGEDDREEVYSWPLTNSCRVEQEIVEGNYIGGAAFLSEAVNVRGYDALEQLLFDPGVSNTCSVKSPINTMGSWDALVGELPSRRADYASTLSMLLAQQTGELREAWLGTGGSWVGILSQAGSDSEIYPTAYSGLNAVSDGLFYFEKVTKDLKLGKPLGIFDCETATCPDLFESPYARADKAHVRANIAAFRLLLSGGEGEALGFDDLLADLGADSLAKSMTDGLDEADAALDAVGEDSLHEALSKDKVSVLAVHTAVKKVADLLKGEFVDTLGLELPKGVQSDND